MSKESDTIESMENSERLQNWLETATVEIYPHKKVLEYFKNNPPFAQNVAITSSPVKPMEETVDIAVGLSSLGYSPVVHLAARNITDSGHLKGILEKIRDARIEKLFVVGGDRKSPLGEYDSSLKLITDIAKLGFKFKIGVTGYPEGHSSISKFDLGRHLLAKQKFAEENGIDMYVVTQMCFDSRIISDWITGQRTNGMTLPIIAGIVGPVDIPTILKFAAKVGAIESARFLGKGELAKDVMEAAATNYEPGEIVRELSGNDQVAGIHIYTFNEVAKSYGWIESQKNPASGR